MKPKPSENPAAFLLGMIGTLYRNPRGYVNTIGELNAVLWFAHFLWSGIAGRMLDLASARGRHYDNDVGRRIGKLEHQPISNAESLSFVVDLWRTIDAELSVDTDPDQFDDDWGQTHSN